MVVTAAGGGDASAAPDLLAQLLAEDAEEERDESAHQSQLQRTLASINSLPLPEAADDDATYTLRETLQTVTRIWHQYLRTQPYMLNTAPP